MRTASLVLGVSVVLAAIDCGGKSGEQQAPGKHASGGASAGRQAAGAGTSTDAGTGGSTGGTSGAGGTSSDQAGRAAGGRVATGGRSGRGGGAAGSNGGEAGAGEAGQAGSPENAGSGGAPDALVPAELGSRLVLWLDGNQGVTAANGAKMSSWQDQSGAHNDAFQAVSERQPSFDASGTN
jgi:hypothetical protein